MAGEKSPRISEDVLYYTEKEGQKNSAFIFQGQGAKEVGLGRELCDYYPEVKDLYKRADQVLRSWFKKIPVEEGQPPITSLLDFKEKHFKKTEFAQPAIFVFNEACRIAFVKQRKLENKPEIKPKYYAGASLGLYNALLAGGAFSFEDGLRLVQKRAKFMQEACDKTPSALIALSANDESLIKNISEVLIDTKLSGLYKEADNSETQIIFGGKENDVEQAQLMLEKVFGSEIKVDRLDVNGAFHTPFMKPAEKRFGEVVKRMMKLKRINKLQTPVISNVTAKPIKFDFQIQNELINHLTMPVLWKQTIDFFDEEYLAETIELGENPIYSKLMNNKGKMVTLSIIGAATLVFFKRREKKKKD